MKFLYTLLAFALMVSVNAQELGKFTFKDDGYSGKKFKHAEKRIYIQYFTVNYQTVMVEYAKAKGGNSYGSAFAGLALGLDEITNEQLQAMTDAYYELYVKRLEDAGFTIVSAEEMAKHPKYAGSTLVPGGKPQQDGMARGYLTTMPTKYSFIEQKIGAFDYGGLGASKDLDGILIARVNLVVPFAESKSLEGGPVGGVAKITAKCDLRLSPQEVIPTQSDWQKPTTLVTECSFGYKKNLKYQDYYYGNLKKALEIEKVLDEDKKYKASSVATTGSGFTAKYSEAYAENLVLVPCDKNKYQEGVNQALLQYLNASLDGFLGNF